MRDKSSFSDFKPEAVHRGRPEFHWVKTLYFSLDTSSQVDFSHSDAFSWQGFEFPLAYVVIGCDSEIHKIRNEINPSSPPPSPRNDSR